MSGSEASQPEMTEWFVALQEGEERQFLQGSREHPEERATACRHGRYVLGITQALCPRHMSRRRDDQSCGSQSHHLTDSLDEGITIIRKEPDQ